MYILYMYVQMAHLLSVCRHPQPRPIGPGFALATTWLGGKRHSGSRNERKRFDRLEYALKCTPFFHD